MAAERIWACEFCKNHGFINAIKNQDVATVKQFLTLGIDIPPNAEFDQDWVIAEGFHIACKNNFREIVDVILESQPAQCALEYGIDAACCENHIDLAIHIMNLTNFTFDYKGLELGYDYEYEWDDGSGSGFETFNRGWACACASGNLRLVQSLCDHGINIDHTFSAAYYDSDIFGNFEDVQELFDEDEEWRFTGFEFAIINGNIEILKYLVSIGYDVNNTAIHSPFPPLNLASYNENPETIEYLTHLGVNVNQEYYDGSPLTIACEWGNIENVKMLVEQNADVNFLATHIVSYPPVTSFTNACNNFYSPQPEIIEVLLNHGCKNYDVKYEWDCYDETRSGLDELHTLLQTDFDPKICQILIEFGYACNPEFLTNEQLIAETMSYFEKIELMQNLVSSIFPIETSKIILSFSCLRFGNKRVKNLKKFLASQN